MFTLCFYVAVIATLLWFLFLSGNLKFGRVWKVWSIINWNLLIILMDLIAIVWNRKDCDECRCYLKFDGFILDRYHKEGILWSEGEWERNVCVWLQAYWHGGWKGHIHGKEQLHLKDKTKRLELSHTHHIGSSYHSFVVWLLVRCLC